MGSNAQAHTQEQLFQYVYTWLKSKYKDRPIPRFEVTPRTLGILYDIAQINESRDKDCLALIQECEQRKAEYQAAASRLQHDIDASGIKLDTNPHSVLNSCVDALASLAVTLGINDTRTSSYYIALNDLRLKMDLMATQHTSEVQQSSDILFKTQNVIQRLTKLRRVVERLEERAAAARHTTHVRQGEISYLTTKRTEYEKEIQDFQDKKELNGDETNVRYTHPVLVASAEQLQQLQALTAHLNEVLSSYMDLPPDINLATLKIEEVKNNLAILEEKLSTQLNSIL